MGGEGESNGRLTAIKLSPWKKGRKLFSGSVRMGTKETKNRWGKGEFGNGATVPHSLELKSHAVSIFNHHFNCGMT